ncbi:MAG TPA: hypothetical protein VHK06_07135 [Candidatus Limnocylindria bacterium]|nr:hypothetical protein [Candidatus Limnocylindria bacterium]
MTSDNGPRDAAREGRGDPRTAELEARIAELERRLEEQGASRGMAGDATRAAGRSAQEAVSTLSRSIFPDDARTHLRAATREQLLAARVYLDRWIARLEAADASAAPRRHETIEIEE